MMPNTGPRDSDEVPRDVWKQWRQIQDWVFAGTREWGFTVSADHQFLTVGDSTIRAGMLRGTRFSPVKSVGARRPAVSKPGSRAGGYLHFPLLLYVRQRQLGRDEIIGRGGMALNTPLIPVISANELSTKPLPPVRSFCSLDADNLVITALKKADADGAIVVRAFEIRGDKAESPIRFLGRDRKFSAANLLKEVGPEQEEDLLRLGPYEISTVKIHLPELTKGTE